MQRLDNAFDFEILAAILDRHGNDGAHRVVDRAVALGAAVESAQIERLNSAEQSHRKSAFGELDDAQGVAGGDGAHRDLVLVVALGGAAEDAGRHGQFERLGGQRAGRDLHGLEAVVGVGCGALHAEQVGGQAIVERLVAHQRQLAVGEVGEVGHG